MPHGPAIGVAAGQRFVAYLDRLGVVGASSIEFLQAEDMGVPCLLRADLPTKRGGPARVHGPVRIISEA